MKVNAGILAAGPRPSGRPAKVGRISSYERPIAGENERLQLPVFRAGTPEPCDVGGSGMACCLSPLRQLLAQAFVNQELHPAFRRTIRRVITRAPAGSGVGPRGRPRGGLACA